MRVVPLGRRTRRRFAKPKERRAGRQLSCASDHFGICRTQPSAEETYGNNKLGDMDMWKIVARTFVSLNGRHEADRQPKSERSRPAYRTQDLLDRCPQSEAA